MISHFAQARVFSLSILLSLLTTVPVGAKDEQAVDQIGKLDQSALAAYKAKKYAESEKIYKQCVDQLKNDKEAELALADAYQNLSLALKAQNKLEESKKAEQSYEVIRKKLHLPDNKRTAAQASFVNAEERHGVDKMFKEVADIIDGKDPLFSKDKIKDASPDKFKKILQTSWAMREAGDPHRAAAGFRAAIATAFCFPTPNKMQVEAMNGLAGVYRTTGRNMASLMLYQACISIQEKLSKADDPYLATLLDNSALVYVELGNLAQAKTNQERALATYKKTLPADSMDLAQTMANLAETYALMKQTDKAEQLMKDSIAIYKKHKSEDDPSVLISMDNLAALYAGKGQFAKAEPIQRKVVAGLQKQYKKNPVLAESLGNLAATLEGLKKYPESEKLLKQSIDMNKEMFGPSHPKTIYYMERYADFLKKTGRAKESAEYTKSIPKMP